MEALALANFHSRLFEIELFKYEQRYPLWKVSMRRIRDWKALSRVAMPLVD
jgi:hypothetical protein